MRSARMQQLWMKMSLRWWIIIRLFDRFIDRGRVDSFNAVDIITQEAVITTLANKTTNAAGVAVNAAEEVEAAGTIATETTGTTNKTSTATRPSRSKLTGSQLKHSSSVVYRRTSPNTFPRQSTYNRSVA